MDPGFFSTEGSYCWKKSWDDGICHNRREGLIGSRGIERRQEFHNTVHGRLPHPLLVLVQLSEVSGISLDDLVCRGTTQKHESGCRKGWKMERTETKKMDVFHC